MQALAESHSSHKRAAADGESREEHLLGEAASKEAHLTQTIEELQGDAKHLRSQLDNTIGENERLGLALQDLRKVTWLLSKLEVSVDWFICQYWPFYINSDFQTGAL